MTRKIAVFALSLCLLLGLGGCMDYRGLNELSIVAGIAVDEDKENPGDYRLSFEIVDTNAGGEQKGKKTILLEGAGRSIFDAIGNGNEQLAKDLYFGNAEVLIIHQDVARNRGLVNIIEPLIRDNTVRETMLVVISRDESAKKILEPTPEQEKIISYDIAESLNWQKSGADSTRSRELYQIYDDLRRDTDSISLPAYQTGALQSPPQVELSGLAVFQKGRIAGYLEAPDVQYFMYLADKLERGTFTFNLFDDEKLDVTLRIASSKPKLWHLVENGELTLTAKVEITASVSAYSPYAPFLDESMVSAVEREAERVLNNRIHNTVSKMQSKTGTDIFGFGRAVYHADPKYWKTIKDDWERMFSEAEVKVESSFHIDKTGSLIRF